MGKSSIYVSMCLGWEKIRHFSLLSLQSYTRAELTGPQQLRNTNSSETLITFELTKKL